MFRSVPGAPPDPILGLAEAFRSDPREEKLNLTVGVYCESDGTTPVLDVVRAAEQQLLETEQTKTYLPITGSPRFRDGVRELLFPGDEAIAPRVAVADTPGGTGALSVVARLAWVTSHTATIWVSDPTWPNHRAVFADAGLGVQSYRYANAAGHRVPVEELLADLGRAGAGDLVVLHGCCHNPTGADLTPEDWSRIAAVLAERGAVAVVDAAYVGLGDGVEADTAGIRTLAEAGVELFVCLSFSKNLGLYAERVGALVTVAPDPESCHTVDSRVKACARSLYSNPPKHGGEAAAIVLTDPELRAAWLEELATMRDRINGLRGQLADQLAGAGLDLCPAVDRGRGLFSLTGLTRDQVVRLREERGIYLVENGRINVAALTEETIGVLVDALGRLYD